MSTLSSRQFPERLHDASPAPGARDRMREVRAQAAVVRALLDELERASGLDAPVGEQIVEELARLGCRIWEAASEMTAAVPSPDSGMRLRLAET